MTDEYLTVNELAARLKLKPKTVRNRMYGGTWQRGVHWFSRVGIGPRFKWSAVMRWLEAPDDVVPVDGAAFGIEVPAAVRGRPRRTREVT